MTALDSALMHLLQAQERHTIDRLDERYAQAAVDFNQQREVMDAEVLVWITKARAAYLASGLIVQAAAQEYTALIDERYLHAAK